MVRCISGRGRGLAAYALDLEFARALRHFAFGNLASAMLGLINQQLAADQVFHRILEDCARLLRGVRIDETLLGLGVVPHLSERDGRAVDRHHDGVFRIGFHQRQDAEKSLLPREPRFLLLLRPNVRDACKRGGDRHNQANDKRETSIHFYGHASNDIIAYTPGSVLVKDNSAKAHSPMKQLRVVSIVVAIIACVLALISGAILFFVIEPPFLASIFLACAAIAIGCFIVAAIAGYFSADEFSD